jgi:hypothetical protein
LLQSGSAGNGKVSPDKGQLYTNLPAPASSGDTVKSAVEYYVILLYTFKMGKKFPHLVDLALVSGSTRN